jgi:hypothetical protein
MENVYENNKEISNVIEEKDIHSIKDLNLESNEEKFKELCKLLRKSKSIKSLNILYQSTSEKEKIKNYCKKLQEGNEITDLEFYRTELGSDIENIKEISKAIKENNTIKEIVIWGHDKQMGNYEVIKELCILLKDHNVIRKLILWRIKLGIQSNNENLKEHSHILKEKKTKK